MFFFYLIQKLAYHIHYSAVCFSHLLIYLEITPNQSETVFILFGNCIVIIFCCMDLWMCNRLFIHSPFWPWSCSQYYHFKNNATVSKTVHIFSAFLKRSFQSRFLEMGLLNYKLIFSLCRYWQMPLPKCCDPNSKTRKSACFLTAWPIGYVCQAFEISASWSEITSQCSFHLHYCYYGRIWVSFYKFKVICISVLCTINQL